MDERIQKLSAMGRFGDNPKLPQPALKVIVMLVVAVDGIFPLIGPPVLSHLIENVNLIVSCLHVMLGTLLNFEGNVGIKSKIFC